MQQCVRGLSLFHLSIVFLFFSFFKKKMNGQMIDSVFSYTVGLRVAREHQAFCYFNNVGLMLTLS